MNTNISWNNSKISIEERVKKNKHAPCIIWMTGLSGSGKSTISNLVEQKLFQCNKSIIQLDGDNLRHGLCSNLTFSIQDRSENMRRAAEVAKLFAQYGNIVLVTLISPLKADRDTCRNIIKNSGIEFFEIYLDCDIETCKTRDPKGIYKLASEGKIKNFTGLDSPYEIPGNPELIIKTTQQSVEQSAELLINFLHIQKIL